MRMADSAFGVPAGGNGLAAGKYRLNLLPDYLAGTAT